MSTGLPEGVASSVRVVARSTVVLAGRAAGAGIGAAGLGRVALRRQRRTSSGPCTRIWPADPRRRRAGGVDDRHRRRGTPPAALAAELLATPLVGAGGRRRPALRRHPRPGARRRRSRVLDRPGDGGAVARLHGRLLRPLRRAPHRLRTLDDAAFVDRLYRNIFGRAPDPAGLAYWVERLQVGRTRGSVVVGFTQSPEGRLLLGPVAEVAVVWFALTGTAPPAAVRADAVAWRAAGGSRLTLVDSVRSRTAFATAHG